MSRARLVDSLASLRGGAARLNLERRCHPAIVIAYALTGVGIVLFSGLTTQITRVPLSAELGLLQLLPPSYWLGLSLIVVSAAIAVWTGSNGLVAFTGAVLLGTLAGTPTPFEPIPRYWDTYTHFAEAQNLGLYGRLPSSTFLYSANWPGAFLTFFTLSGASGTSALEFVAWFPFLAGSLTFLAMFELLRGTFVPDVARRAAVPTALFAVWAQYHVSPQSLGFILLLLILATFRRRETRWRFVTAVLFLGLVGSHPTSAILLLSILSAYAMFMLIPQFREPVPRDEFRKDARFSMRVAVTFAVVWLAWLFFLAIGSVEATQVAIVARMNLLLGIPEQTLNLATQRTHADLLPWAPRIRTATLGIYGIFGLVALASLFRDRPYRDRFRVALSVLFASAFVAFLDIFAFGGQLYDRSLLLIATFMPAVCFAGLHRIRIPRPAKAAVLAILVGASVATGSTVYYLEAFNIVPAESVAASNFISTLPAEAVVFNGRYPKPIWLDPAQRPAISEFEFTILYPAPLRNYSAQGRPVYAVYDPTAEIWYRQWYGPQIYRLYSDERSNYSLVYDNGWTQVYVISEG